MPLNTGAVVVYSDAGWRLVIQFVPGAAWRGELFPPRRQHADHVYVGKREAADVVESAVTSLQVMKLPVEAASLSRAWKAIR